MTHKSCIKCDHYVRCKDPKRSIIYFCDRYKETSISILQEKAFLENALEMPIRTSTAMPFMPSMDESMFDVSAALDEMLEDKRIVSPDIKIPEGDFAEAPNFHTWCVSDLFLDQKPFIMQSLIGTKLFAEYCPDCSDVDWMENEVRAKDSLDTFVRKVALLEHGKCPHCGKTRLHFFKKRSLAPYWELSLCAGQRSGKSALFGMMASYLTHRMIKLERPNEVLGLLKANVLQGTFVALTFAQAKDTLWEPFYGHLLEAPWFCIAEGTPISMVDGSTIEIQNVQAGAVVKTLQGCEQVLKVFDNGLKECKTVTLEDGNSVTGTDGHLVRCLSDSGDTLVWKKISELTENDYVVSQDAGQC